MWGGRGESGERDIFLLLKSYIFMIKQSWGERQGWVGEKYTKNTRDERSFLTVPENGGALQEILVNLGITPVKREAFPIFLGVPN